MNNNNNNKNDANIFLNQLQKQPLAFSSLSDLICSSKRLAFKTSDNSTILNVELFESDDDDKGDKKEEEGEDQEEKIISILLFVHGICESIETTGVQAIVKEARERSKENHNHNVKVAVLELEGHGLSSSSSNSSGRAVCTDFNKLIQHVVEFIKHVLSSLSHVIDNNSSSNNNKSSNIRFALCGSSLGGVLATYAAEEISKEIENENKIDQEIIINRCKFVGLATLAPAVGINPNAIPSYGVVQALKIMSYVFPSSTVPLTPYEDPSHYNCPSNTTRNYQGYWPLGTSKMLLDVTAYKVKKDFGLDLDLDGEEEVDSGNNDDKKVPIIRLNNVPSLLLIGGKNDHIVPIK